jgi:predicted nucleic acid-binding protein
VIRFLLDTNVLSETRKIRPHGAVLQWLGSLSDEQVFLSAVTLGEIQAGIELTRRQDVRKAEGLEEWLAEVASTFYVLPMDSACCIEWGRIRIGKPERILEDAMIAATARVHDLVVATRNQRDFAGLDVRVFNPFTVR